MSESALKLFSDYISEVFPELCGGRYLLRTIMSLLGSKSVSEVILQINQQSIFTSPHYYGGQIA